MYRLFAPFCFVFCLSLVEITIDLFTAFHQLIYTNLAIVFIQIFLGNRNQNDLVSHELIPPIQARYIRVIPESWHIHIALRVEFYGCLASKNSSSSSFCYSLPSVLVSTPYTELPKVECAKHQDKTCGNLALQKCCFRRK